MSSNNQIDPQVDAWYRRRDNDQVFLVVYVDEEEGLIELQHSDGDLEELGLDEWHDLDLEIADAPDDWTGPIDDIEPEDFSYSATRSEGERRGMAETSRSERLQSAEDERQLSDEFGADVPGEEGSEEDAAGEPRDRGQKWSADENDQ